MKHQILIVGAQGKTGSRVEKLLQTAGIETRGVSRSTLPAFNWSNPATWESCLEGVTSAYLTYHPDLSVPEAAHHIAEFSALAKAKGVEHIVLLSGRGEEGATQAEQALIDSGVSWNIVQASWFAQNFSESFMLDGVLQGTLVMPEGSAKEPFIDADDIADVVVAALLEPGLRNRLFEVTGPRLMSFADCASAISNATKQPVTVLEVPMTEYLSALRQEGLTEDFISLLEDLFGKLFDGRNAHVAQGVQEALGRPATDFTSYVEKTVATEVWQRQQASWK